MNNPSEKTELTAIIQKLCPAVCGALLVIAPMSASLAASAQIPRGTVLMEKNKDGSGCTSDNGKSYNYGDTKEVEVTSADGKTKTTVKVVCTRDGWVKK